MNISVVIIARNESMVISRAINSVSFADEIIVIDNNSNDETEKVAKNLKAKVYSSKSNDFSELRNLGKDYSKSDFVFYLDADEEVSEELRKNIINVINSTDFRDAYRIERKNFYLGENEWLKIEEMERLFYKPKLIGWTGKIHESPIVNGSIGKLNGYLNHYTHRDLNQMLHKTIDWSDTEAEVRLLSEHPKMNWWRFPRVMIPVFINYYIKQKGYRLGTIGLIESMYQTFSIFITYAKLWEKQNRPINKS